MARCKNPKCNKDVGCGCGLKGGLCAKCAEEKRKEEQAKANAPK